MADLSWVSGGDTGFILWNENPSLSQTRNSGVAPVTIRWFWHQLGMMGVYGFGVVGGRLTRRRVAGKVILMEVRTVSFEALQRDKRRARKRDELRLARGEVTPEQLQEENSLIPMGTKITILNFCETIERHYGK
jgi:hypothetical protein